MKNTHKHENTHMDHSHPQYIHGSADLEVDFPLGKSTTSSTHYQRVMENPAFSSLLASHKPLYSILYRIYPLVMTNSLRTWTWPSRNSRIYSWKMVDLSIVFCIPEGRNHEIRTITDYEGEIPGRPGSTGSTGSRTRPAKWPKKWPMSEPLDVI